MQRQIRTTRPRSAITIDLPDDLADWLFDTIGEDGYNPTAAQVIIDHLERAKRLDESEREERRSAWEHRRIQEGGGHAEQ